LATKIRNATQQVEKTFRIKRLNVMPRTARTQFPTERGEGSTIVKTKGMRSASALIINREKEIPPIESNDRYPYLKAEVFRVMEKYSQI
jgi:hypothetical protein